MKSQAQKPAVRFLPSVSCDAEGEPRFVMPIPTAFEETDFSVRHLVKVESEFGGYEAPLQRFLDAHLKPGDVFIDIGAHWGVMSMSAATTYPGQVDVLAIEAHPVNAQVLSRWVRFNGLAEMIETVPVACGEAEGTGTLVMNTSMGHSLYHSGAAARGPSMSVPVRSVDALLAERPDLQGRPTILKIDVEGAEPEVMAGAKDLLASGLVKAIVWEKGLNCSPRSPERWHAFIQTAHALTAAGFENLRLVDEFLGGPLVPWIPTIELHNIYSVARGLETKASYDRCYVEQGTYDELVTSLNNRLFEPELHQKLTEYLTELEGTEAGRWSCWQHVCEGAEARASALAPWLPQSGRILDIGAGAMALRSYVADDDDYVPVDLLPWAEDTYVMDLNSATPLPEGVFAVAVLANVLEYVHDVPRLLARVRESAESVIISYPTVEAVTQHSTRQARGYFNHYGRQQLSAMIAEAGFVVCGSFERGDSVYFQLKQPAIAGLAVAS